MPEEPVQAVLVTEEMLAAGVEQLELSIANKEAAHLVVMRIYYAMACEFIEHDMPAEMPPLDKSKLN